MTGTLQSVVQREDGQSADGRAAINFAGWLDTPDLPLPSIPENRATCTCTVIYLKAPLTIRSTCLLPGGPFMNVTVYAHNQLVNCAVASETDGVALI